MDKTKLGALIATWNEHEIYKGHAAYLREEDPTLSEEAALEQAWADPDLLELEWDDLVECLNEHLQKANPHGRTWFVSGENLGWQGRSGYTTTDRQDARSLLGRILPDCEKTFFIYPYSLGRGRRRGLAINCYHHDTRFAGAGGEWYVLIPMSKEREERYNA